jgi:hypothetical protein
MSSRQFLAALALILFVSPLGAAGPPQNPNRDAQLKTVRGLVLDKSDNGVSTAVVVLKNVRSNQVRSYIADQQGNYRFSGLDPNADYELYAEKDGANSQVRNISSFDARTDIVLNLKIAEKKKS